MAQARPKVFDFSRGLQTSALEDGQPLPEFQTFQDVRTSQGTAKVRDGMSRVLDTAKVSGATDFEASSTQYAKADVDTTAMALGLNWTIEALVNLETLTSGTLLYIGHTTASVIIDLSSSKWRARMWDTDDSASTCTTAADAITGDTSIQLKRDGATLTLTVDNDVETTDTPSATLLNRVPVGDIRVGADHTPGNYLDAVVDYIRIYGITRPNHNDRLLRFADPRADFVLADWDMKITGDGIIKDRSQYENHLLGVAGNVPTSATALCHQSALSQGINYHVGPDGKKYAVWVAGGNVYHVEL